MVLKVTALDTQMMKPDLHMQIGLIHMFTSCCVHNRSTRLNFMNYKY